jgi:hypothetical protein
MQEFNNPMGKLVRLFADFENTRKDQATHVNWWEEEMKVTRPRNDSSRLNTGASADDVCKFSDATVP